MTITAEDATTTLTYTITVARVQNLTVPHTWSLIPSGLSIGDEFRLIFLSSTKYAASSSSIGTYNTWIQGRAAAGHDDIQGHSDGFTVVGCTAAVDARDNTNTTYVSTDKGVPIYWLNGAKVADEYEDFYDGSWDDEANDKNESGANGPNTSDNDYYPITGCNDDGTERTASGTTQSYALGSSLGITVARPNSTDTGHGPLSSGFQVAQASARPMYGLSEVFRVIEAGDATLSDLAIETTTGGETVNLTPAFAAGTLTYTATVSNRFDAVTLSATTNDSNARLVITNDDNTTSPNEAELDLDVGNNTLTVNVTAEDTVTTETYTVTVKRERDPTEPVNVPIEWSLVPSGLGDGDQFRLLFLTGTRRDGSSSAITDYNVFVRVRAAAGHTDIQAYSDGFMAVGCTAADDARDNTGTTYTSTDKGVPIYWLAGNKVADEYEDFYDGDWDDEVNDKNEDGNNGPNTSDSANYPLTGCSDDGTEKISASVSSALGNGSEVTIARPNSSGAGHGPISSNQKITETFTRPMYGLSPAFRVVVTGDATLSDLAIEGATGGESITFSPAFDEATTAYTVSVGNRIDSVTLTAIKNDSDATVAITNDDNTNTKGEADLDLNVGDTTLTVTVTAENGITTKPYTVTVTRAAIPPAPTDCPADATWCTTMGVGYTIGTTGETQLDIWGYRTTTNDGDLRSTTFSHEGSATP